MLFKIKLKEHCKQHHAECWNTLKNLDMFSDVWFFSAENVHTALKEENNILKDLEFTPQQNFYFSHKTRWAVWDCLIWTYKQERNNSLFELLNLTDWSSDTQYRLSTRRVLRSLSSPDSRRFSIVSNLSWTRWYLDSDFVIGLAKCSSWSRPSPAIYAFFLFQNKTINLACLFCKWLM